jgi:hypothetical protein
MEGVYKSQAETCDSLAKVILSPAFLIEDIVENKTLLP